MAHRNTPLILGWGHTPFGKRADDTLESLVVEAGREAISDAGLEPGEVDMVVVSTFNAGMHPLGFISSLALQIDDSLFRVPALRVENACASGSAAVHPARAHVRAGLAERVLVIGVEKMTGIPPATVGSALLAADYEHAGKESNTGFAGLFGTVAAEYEQRYGEIADVLGSIAAKSHHLGAQNPYAHLRKDLGQDFCRTVSKQNPAVAGILRRTDCSPISDGAAAPRSDSRAGSALSRPSMSNAMARSPTSSDRSRPRATTWGLRTRTPIFEKTWARISAVPSRNRTLQWPGSCDARTVRRSRTERRRW